MPGYIAHPTNENLRLKVERDPHPAKPYNDGGFPIWRIDSSGFGGYAVQETDITSYVAPHDMEDGITQNMQERDLEFGARYLRIFWGATFTRTWHSGSHWYLTGDPAPWREHVGVTDEDTKREGYADDPFHEWEAWVEGEVYMATEQRRLWQRTTTRTWDPTRAENPEDPESSDEIGEDTTEGYVWEDMEFDTVGTVGGFYGDVDEDMAATMAWQFGWEIPEGHTLTSEEE